MTEDDLAAIKEELSETGYVRRKTVRKKIKLKNEPLHYISSDGFHMYVGKNNLQMYGREVLPRLFLRSHVIRELVLHETTSRIRRQNQM